MASKKIPAPEGFEAWMLLLRCMSSAHTSARVREDLARAHVAHIMDLHSRQQDKIVDNTRPKTEDNMSAFVLDLLPQVVSPEEMKFFREKTVSETIVRCMNAEGIPMEPFTAKTIDTGAPQAYDLRDMYGDELSIK